MMATLLLLIATVSLLAYRLVVRKARAMVRLSRVPRGAPVRRVAIYLLLPLAAIALYSFATSWTAHALPDGYTLAHWRSRVQRMRGSSSALGRTFLLALAVLLARYRAGRAGRLLAAGAQPAHPHR